MVARAVDGRWMPGQSANPLGMTPQFRHVRDLAREHTEAAIKTLVAMLDSDDDRVRVVAAQCLLDRGWGKPPQEISARVETTHADPHARLAEIAARTTTSGVDPKPHE